jgi:hypothetical protein
MQPSSNAAGFARATRAKPAAFYVGNQMMKQFVAAALLAALSALAEAQSKDFWQAKDYKEWSEKECRKLLENSPWAQDFTVAGTTIDPLQSASGDRARESNSRITYRVQFSSALPLRQALVRTQQLANNYDRMPPEQKQAFDEKAAKLLLANFAEVIAVHVGYSSNVQLYDREMANYWQTRTNDQLKNSTFLIGPQGRKIPPQRFTTATGAGREFTFYFPRVIDGQPLVGPRDKTLKLEFMHPRISNEKEERVLLEFKVEKMIVQEAVVY